MLYRAECAQLILNVRGHRTVPTVLHHIVFSVLCSVPVDEFAYSLSVSKITQQQFFAEWNDNLQFSPRCTRAAKCNKLRH